MSQHRRARGRKTERLVCDYFIEQGFPNATIGGSGESGSDIRGLPFDVEIKARKGVDFKATIAQQKKRSDGMGIAVFRLNGQGEDVGSYMAAMPMDLMVSLLKQAGYNKSQKPEPIRCDKCGSWKLEGLECSTCQIMITNALNAK